MATSLIFGTFSSHETKNYNTGDAGALLIKNPIHNDEADNLKDSGTDRQGFHKVKVCAYSWIRLRSSKMLSELDASYVYGQLTFATQVNERSVQICARYYQNLNDLSSIIDLPIILSVCHHNAHIFFIKTKDEAKRKQLINHLKEHDFQAVFHYIPLQSSIAGRNLGRLHGEDKHTSIKSSRMLRLPLYYALSNAKVDKVCENINTYYKK